MLNIRRHVLYYIWVRSRNCGCLVTWFCYQLIAKPGNKTVAVSWPDPYDFIKIMKVDKFTVKKHKKLPILHCQYMAADALVLSQEPGHQQRWYGPHLYGTFSCLHKKDETNRQLTLYGLVMPYGEICIIGSGNGLLPDGTKPLPEPMLTYHYRDSVPFTWEQFHSEYPSYHSV